jgi:hypothetical protein
MFMSVNTNGMAMVSQKPPITRSHIVRADALSIRNHAASLAFQLSHGII